MANPFAWLTFGQVKAEVSLRLGDESNVFWTDAEIGMSGLCFKVLVHDLPMNDSVYGTCRTAIYLADPSHGEPRLVRFDNLSGFFIRELAVLRTLSAIGLGKITEVFNRCALSQPKPNSMLSVFARCYIFQVLYGIVNFIPVYVVNDETAWSGTYKAVSNYRVHCRPVLLPILIKKLSNLIASSVYRILEFNEAKNASIGADKIATAQRWHLRISYSVNFGHGTRIA